MTLHTDDIKIMELHIMNQLKVIELLKAYPELKDDVTFNRIYNDIMTLNKFDCTTPPRVNG